MPHTILGHAVQRREDPALLTGAARFVADLACEGTLVAHFVRSQVAAGSVRRLDVTEAAAAPGVVGVFTAADLDLPDLQPGPGPRPGGQGSGAAGQRSGAASQRSSAGSPGRLPGGPPADPNTPSLGRPCLARSDVRFVGEALAVVVATSPAAAVDAAELVVVEVDEREPVLDPLAAAGAGTSPTRASAGTPPAAEAAGAGTRRPATEDGDLLVDPALGTNVVVDVPPTLDAETALEGADVVVRATFRNQRVAPAPLEPNGALAAPGATGGVDIWASTQSPFGVRAVVASALGLDPDQVRVVAPAVGGGFGAKGGAYPEVVVVAALARRLGRPVRWVETRSENLVAMTHGRGQVQQVALGARRDGTLVGLAARTVTDCGAYAWRGAIATMTSRLMGAGPYRLDRVSLHTQAVLTNTTPTGPYRGAGRPEAAAMLERAMDLLAAELDLDPAELRRRNLLSPAELPHDTPTGAAYDSGDYPGALALALETAGYDELRAEQAARLTAHMASSSRGSTPLDGRASRPEGQSALASGVAPGPPAQPTRLLGIGIASFVEVSGSGWEYGGVTVEPDGTVTVRSGSAPHGQGHETVLAQVTAEVLGVDPQAVRVVHSDTAAVARGIGTFGSRSGQLAGSAVHVAAVAVLDRARKLAADSLEAAVEDLEAGPGGITVAGTPTRGLRWAELAALAAEEGAELAAAGDFSQDQGTYPYGTHVAVVEVDTETGGVTLRRLVAADDCGRILNPLVVEGQVHGGLAQGVAQALYEAVAYDAAGNPLTTNLAEYAMPAAPELPSYELASLAVPTPRNPLGAKGIGESGTVGATAAVQNAVLDALRPLGVHHLDMPLTPERIWSALAASTMAASGRNGTA